MSLLTGDGSGNLRNAASILTLNGAQHLTTGDLDGDEDFDLLATNSRGITQVLYNNGKGNFGALGSFLVGEYYYTQTAIADLDGDNALDVVTGNVKDNVDFFFNKPVVLPVKGSSPTLPIALYPNPAHDQLTLQLPPTTKAATIALLNALGQQVASIPATRPAADGRITLPISGIAAGMYVVQIEADKIRTTQRVVIK